MYERILVALDGSEWSTCAGRMALAVAGETGARVLACHVYAARLHTERFEVMEPGLPGRYQDEDALTHLRSAHTSLIGEGLQALSSGYVAPFLRDAQAAGVPAEEVHVEGRNHVRLLEAARERAADLIALGAHGLGALDDGLLGSTASRVLRQAPCDVLIARRDPADGPVLVGIDGSPEAEAAIPQAAVWARALGTGLHLAAAYDPFLHRNVFEAMTQSLCAERQREVGLDRQEDLHKRFIDDGLGILYQQFLDQAAAGAEGAAASLLQGKAYRAVAREADRLGAGLIVVGRHGHHREGDALIGSNAEAIARTASTNVVIVGGTPIPPPDAVETEAAASQHAPGELEWDADAVARLEGIPSFARPMARRGIESHVRSNGGDRVTLADVLAVGRNMGMGTAE